MAAMSELRTVPISLITNQIRKSKVKNFAQATAFETSCKNQPGPGFDILWWLEPSCEQPARTNGSNKKRTWACKASKVLDSPRHDGSV